MKKSGTQTVHSFIFLTGFMLAGKSTVGKRLAEILNLPFYDTDDLIVEKTGMEISAIFKNKGEDYFRRIERGVILEILEKPAGVVALGGGAVINDWAIPFLKQKGLLIFLNSSPQTILRRTGSHQRPLLVVKSEKELFRKIKTLLERRLPYYRQSHLTINTDGKAASEIIEEIVTHLEDKTPIKL